MDHVIIRPGELMLKGNNRRWFERMLHQNLKAALAPHGVTAVDRRHGRYYVGPREDAEKIAREAAKVFGVVHTSAAERCGRSEEEIAELTQTLVSGMLARRPELAQASFRVEVKRSWKQFPRNSMETAAWLGGIILAKHPDLHVDLQDPDWTLQVEIRGEGAFVFLEKIPGAGGLPVGTEGKVMCLLSGGIDSPVAAWQMMKRGCRVEYVHYDAQPFTGPGALEKVRTLARSLDAWQGKSRLWVVPFAPIQLATKDLPQPGYRTVLYRRFMSRIADRLASRRRCKALVTGDSLGQVASQTLDNLCVVEGAREALPILRPLIAFDKQETIALARHIGTYEISIRPFEDCCTLFQPEHPITRGKPEVAAELETLVDAEALVEEALDHARPEEISRLELHG